MYCCRLSRYIDIHDGVYQIQLKWLAKGPNCVHHDADTAETNAYDSAKDVMERIATYLKKHENEQLTESKKGVWVIRLKEMDNDVLSDIGSD